MPLLVADPTPRCSLRLEDNILADLTRPIYDLRSTQCRLVMKSLQWMALGSSNKQLLEYQLTGYRVECTSRLAEAALLRYATEDMYCTKSIYQTLTFVAYLQVRLWDLASQRCAGIVATGSGGRAFVTSLTSAWPGTDLLVAGLSNGHINVLDLRCDMTDYTRPSLL